MTQMNANDWGDFSSARPPPAGTGPGGKDQNCGVDISDQYESDKLQAFAKANGLTDEKGEVLFLAMPVPGFMETLRNYQELGVFGIHFNADARDAGFYASLPQLAGIRDFVCKNG